jgi:hypothetical protein
MMITKFQVDNQVHDLWTRDLGITSKLYLPYIHSPQGDIQIAAPSPDARIRIRDLYREGKIQVSGFLICLVVVIWGGRSG